MDIFYKILPLLILAAAAFLVFKVIMPLLLKYKLNRITRQRSVITIEDKNGFAIFDLLQQVRQIKWSDISTIGMAGKQTVEISLKDSTTMSLVEKDYIGWLSLVKAIPENLAMNETLSNFKKDRFSNLACCSICGKIAVKDGECLNCISDTYEKYCKDTESFGEEIKTERAFIKENQLDWFSAYIDGARVDFYAKEILYDDCPGWSPSVTAFEVIQYDKKQDADEGSA